MIKKCLFPAAGYGTRFLPATKAMPKEMLPVVNKPLIQYGVEEALEAGLRAAGNATEAACALLDFQRRRGITPEAGGDALDLDILRLSRGEEPAAGPAP